MYQVLARKCRPQTFDELVGQTHVARTLTNAVKEDRLAHAYIFAGLRGTGKTSVARILAKCLNCEKGPTATPCGECVPCREIADSRAIDVLELDAATRTQVDNIRELQEVISYAPARDRNKVLIIDEAHMLSKSAANALLKTLEEPPPRVTFVLATTEIQKILPTILSRCQVFEFRRVGFQELAEYLRTICKGEKIEIDDTALERIARAGEGSVRDSLSVLERAVAFCGEKIDDEDVLRMLGGVRFEVLVALVAALAKRDTGAMLDVLDALVDEGHDLLHFWSELIAALRDLLLIRAVPKRQDMLARPAEEAARLREAAEGLTGDDLNCAFQILADLEPVLKSSSQPRFMFESALVRLGSLGAVRPIEEILGELETGDLAAVPARRPSSRPQKKKEPEARADLAPPSVPTPPAPEAPVARVAESAEAAAAPGEGLASRLIASVFDAKPVLGTILQEARAIESIGDALIVRLEDGMDSLARQLGRKENLEVLVDHAARISGRTLRILVDTGGTEHPKPAGTVPSPPPKQPVSRTGGQARRAGAPKKPPGDSNLLDEATSEPGVKKLLRDFGAQVVEIRPLEPPKGSDVEPG
jgi:DNA polymerase-3 subunit gamma/tau